PEPREGECGERRERHGEERRQAGDQDRVEETPREVGLRHDVREVVGAERRRDQRRRAQCAERVERRRDHERDRDQGEHDGDEGDDVPPARALEPRLSGHRLISSRAAERRKPTIDTVATIRKMRIDTAAAKPYWAPPSPNARRYV